LLGINKSRKQINEKNAGVVAQHFPGRETMTETTEITLTEAAKILGVTRGYMHKLLPKFRRKRQIGHGRTSAWVLDRSEVMEMIKLRFYAEKGFRYAIQEEFNKAHARTKQMIDISKLGKQDKDYWGDK